MQSKKRKSAICIFLTANPNKRCDAIAEALGKPTKLISVRLLQLEKAGRVRRLNDVIRLRDVRWSVGRNEVVAARETVSYRGQANIDAMRGACYERLRAGLPANWVEEPEEVCA